MLFRSAVKVHPSFINTISRGVDYYIEYYSIKKVNGILYIIGNRKRSTIEYSTGERKIVEDNPSPVLIVSDDRKIDLFNTRKTNTSYIEIIFNNKITTLTDIWCSKMNNIYITSTSGQIIRNSRIRNTSMESNIIDSIIPSLSSSQDKKYSPSNPFHKTVIENEDNEEVDGK